MYAIIEDGGRQIKVEEGQEINVDYRDDASREERLRRKERFLSRLDTIIQTPWENCHARRLVKRLRRHRNHLFTFLDATNVPSDNNHAEREVRPAVIIRKNIFCNRSATGARNQAVLMSVYRTLKLRGHNPIKTIVSAVAEYLQCRTLPPLPG